MSCTVWWLADTPVGAEHIWRGYSAVQFPHTTPKYSSAQLMPITNVAEMQSKKRTKDV